jgi:hypothetical protein
MIAPQTRPPNQLLKTQLVEWHAVWPKKAHSPPYFADFFDRSAATAYKNPLRLAKNDHFLVSDATTQPVTLKKNVNKIVQF